MYVCELIPGKFVFLSIVGSVSIMYSFSWCASLYPVVTIISINLIEN